MGTLLSPLGLPSYLPWRLAQVVGGDVTWLPSWGPSRMWEGGREQTPKKQKEGWQLAKAGSMVIQGFYGLKKGR